MNIFVSYTLRDGCLAINQLSMLEIALASVGNPYIDIIHNRSFHRQSYVERMLSTADLLLACITRDFFLSPWVQFEIHSALRRKIPIFGIDSHSLHRFCVLSKPAHHWLPPTCSDDRPLVPFIPPSGPQVLAECRPTRNAR